MNAKKTTTPKTLIDAIRYFSDLDIAHDFFATMRWPDGVVCPQCGSREAKYLPKYRRFQCNKVHARRQFTVKTGTVMEDSPMGLDKWAAAFWLEANAKNSISSYEVHRALGITQKSAWFMQHRIRLAMQSGSFTKLSGEVEVDESYIGGLARNMHKKVRERKIGKNTGGYGKTGVLGILQRSDENQCSKVIAEIIPDVKRDTLRPIIRKHVETGSEVSTDALAGYIGLSDEFIHGVVDHAIEYVNGNVHTNGLENFWSLFKRCIKGTHVSIEPFHTFRYLDAECFRFNNREATDGERFAMAMQGAAGKRLTYKALMTWVITLLQFFSSLR
jgi:transposase-like protein